jgi:hypothetical protein
MIDVKFIAEHGPYKIGMCSQFAEDTARELAEQNIVEILRAPEAEPTADAPVKDDSGKPRRVK